MVALLIFPEETVTPKLGDGPGLAVPTENSVDEMSNRTKISENLQKAMTGDDDAPLEVMIVLDVPKRDLSHLFGRSKPAKDSATPQDRDAAIDAAEAAVSDILERTGSDELKRFRNATGILALVSSATLMELAASDFVLEIVENQRLRE